MEILGYIVDLDYICVYCGEIEFEKRGLEYGWAFMADDIYDDVEIIWPESFLDFTSCIQCGQAMEIVDV